MKFLTFRSVLLTVGIGASLGAAVASCGGSHPTPADAADAARALRAAHDVLVATCAALGPDAPPECGDDAMAAGGRGAEE